MDLNNITIFELRCHGT